jgi:hypothetical protein
MQTVRKRVSDIITRTPALKKYLLATLLFTLFSIQLQAQSSGEFNIKATFLYNFTQFIDWPAEAFSAADAPFVIAILGIDPFRNSIDEAVAGEKVNGHPVVVQRFETTADIKSCNILFISTSEAGKLGEIMAALPNKHILTVSDLPDIISSGGIIRFTRQKNKIKLQINLTASKAADLTISSKLLQLAQIIR